MRNPDLQICTSRILVLVASISMSIGCVALADPEQQAANPAEAISTPESSAESLTGPEVYNEICIACHAPPGVGGAPALSDGNAWAARIAQGMDTLIDHALNGYSGSAGIMPRKGGRVDLSDEEIIRAVEYMIEQSAQYADVPNGDAANGRELFMTNGCTACHGVTQAETSMVGPSLFGVVGRKAGTAPSLLGASENLKKYGVTWSAETLDEFLADPDAKVPGTPMAGVLADPGQRADVIAYLYTLTE